MARPLKHQMWWMPGAVLALALLAQIIVYRLETPTFTVHASWAFAPKSFAEARKQAQATALVEVLAVKRGEDLVMAAKGEPTGEDRIPTQRVELRVLKLIDGGLEGEQFTLFQTGGLREAPPAPDTEGDKKQVLRTSEQFIWLEGDPAYKPGERYLLLVEPGPEGLLRTISPEGRYRLQRDNTVVPMVDNELTRSVRGKSVDTLIDSIVRG